MLGEGRCDAFGGKVRLVWGIGVSMDGHVLEEGCFLDRDGDKTIQTFY